MKRLTKKVLTGMGLVGSFVLAITWTGIATAQTPGFNATYEASSGLLPDEVCPPWTLFDTASPEDPSLSGGKLVISTNQNRESMGFLQSASDIAIPPNLVIEERVKLVSGSSSALTRAPIAIGTTTSPAEGIVLWIAQDEMFINLADGVKGPTATVDTDGGFHTYRIEITGASVEVFYDGVLTLTGSTFTSAPTFGAVERIVWGEASGAALGTSEWEFVRHNASTVLCNQPPDCSAADAAPDELWPPNHKMRDIAIVGVTDPDGDPITLTVTGITQDEPVNGLGDGNTAPDGDGVGNSTAQVRAERAGAKKVPGNGRVYEISFDASDNQGGTCSGSVQVCVPHDQRPGHACLDDGQFFDSTSGASPRVTTADKPLAHAFDAYPNPFNPQTTIRYGLPEASYVKLVVYDVLGRQVRVLVDGAREAGTHEVTFDASSLPSGMYVYRIEAGPYAATRTMLLMK